MVISQYNGPFGGNNLADLEGCEIKTEDEGLYHVTLFNAIGLEFDDMFRNFDNIEAWGALLSNLIRRFLKVKVLGEDSPIHALIDSGKLFFRMPRYVDVPAFCRRLLGALTVLRIGMVDGNTRMGASIKAHGGYEQRTLTYDQMNVSAMVRSSERFVMDGGGTGSARISLPNEEMFGYEYIGGLLRRFGGKPVVKTYSWWPDEELPLAQRKFRNFAGKLKKISGMIEQRESESVQKTIADWYVKL